MKKTAYYFDNVVLLKGYADGHEFHPDITGCGSDVYEISKEMEGKTLFFDLNNALSVCGNVPIIGIADVKSNNKTFNYSILNYKGYSLGINSQKDMLVLCNKLEAHGDTLESIHEGYCEYSRLSPEKTDAELADMYMDCNLFFYSIEDYIQFYTEDGYLSIEDAMENFKNALSAGFIVKTSDGYVDINVV